MSNAATVHTIYEAFGRGDVATIIDKLDDAVEWETTVPVSDVPWLQARRGKANIPWDSSSRWRHSRSPVLNHNTIFDGGDKVFVLSSSRPCLGAKSYSFPNNGHLSQFNAAGKVVKYHHVTDTAQMIRMASGK